MCLTDPTNGKVWIEITASDEFTPCHHATFELTDEIKRTVLKLSSLACEYESEFDYVSVNKSYFIDFFEDDDSEEAMRTEGMTLHVDSQDFWFTTWIKNSAIRLETLFMPVKELLTND